MIIVNQLIDITNFFLLKFGYLGLFTFSLIENLFTIIPSELIFPLTGFLSYKGEFNIILISLFGSLGAVTGSAILYYIGLNLNKNKQANSIFTKFSGYFIYKKDLEKVNKWIKTYGIWSIIVFRLLLIARTIVSITAGALRINFYLFITFTFIGSFVWTFLLAYTGYILGENWEIVTNIANKYSKIFSLLLTILIPIIIYKNRGRIPILNRVQEKDIKKEELNSSVTIK